VETLFPNGWFEYLAGGVIMGAGMSLLFVSTGLIGGMSTVFTSVWSYFSRAPFFQEGRFVSSRQWRLVYAAALVAGAFIWMACWGEPFVTGVPAWRLLVGGFIGDVVNVVRGLIPAMRLLTSFIYAFAGLSMVVFLYAFHKAQS